MLQTSFPASTTAVSNKAVVETRGKFSSPKRNLFHNLRIRVRYLISGLFQQHTRKLCTLKSAP